jgi:hypothetical protein
LPEFLKNKYFVEEKSSKMSEYLKNKYFFNEKPLLNVINDLSIPSTKTMYQSSQQEPLAVIMHKSSRQGPPARIMH